MRTGTRKESEVADREIERNAEEGSRRRKDEERQEQVQKARKEYL